MKPVVKTFALQLAFLIPAVAAQAADKPARISIEIDVVSSGAATKGRETAKFTGTEKFRSSFTMLTSGDPENINRLDIAGNAAGEQQSLDEAQARTPGPAQRQAIAAKGQAAVAACKGDTACMMKVAQQLGNETASWNAKAPAPKAGGDHYLTYFSPMPEKCNGDYSAIIRREKSGVFPDVQGLVPYTDTVSADYTASALEKSSLCGQVAMMVLDTATNKFYATVFPAMQIRGKNSRKEGSRPLRESDGEVLLQYEVTRWVLAKMKNGLPKSGKEHAQFTAPADAGWQGEKQFTVDFRWSFEGK
jgi:hypothetical protein